MTDLLATPAERKAEDEVFEQARRAILFGEAVHVADPPTEVELLRREVKELRDRLRLVAEVLAGTHDCGDEW